ncbi:MAG: hypothetical protein Q8O59_04365 [bacterium]|nr:hypothetical protein [bacterium]
MKFTEFNKKVWAGMEGGVKRKMELLKREGVKTEKGKVEDFKKKTYKFKK